ncbi:hypothetical protein ACFPZK_09610 [Psychrobacter urativorans]|uniref:hypothetical protein n=1 Tax=Psychrobacter urativorans TaxID=45610 RepID=UPI001918B80B|nr:hypothetical protein [Psychrobacter urativorans]
MNNKFFFERIPNYFILLAIAILVFFKLIFYILVKSDLILSGFGTGSDAIYYHGYATGLYTLAVNIWPVILRYLNNIGLYSRNSISYILFFLSLFAIPFITAKLASLTFRNNQKHYLYIILICIAYPTPYVFVFDIFRDVFMVFIFLISCMIVKKFVDSKNFLFFIFYLCISIIIGFFLLWLRPYLGYAFLVSLLLWKIKFSKNKILFLGFFYFLILFILNYIGALDLLTEYRSGFKEIGGGSTLGLDFSNPIMFIPNFIFSFLGQMLGLYITNPLAVVLLLIETVPFFFMLIYVLKNIKLADNFVRFLIIFFVIYASVWLIGNDNLGTAVRLRMYNYFAIYISFFYILRLKSNTLKNLKGIKR